MPGRDLQHLHTNSLPNRTTIPAAIPEKSEKPQHTLCALETCPCCECALRWRGWGAGAGAGGCSQLLGLLLPSWAQGWWAGCRTWAFAIWHANLGKNCCSYLPLVWNMWGCWGERNSDGEHCVASATPPVLTEAWSTAREAEECRSKQNNKEFRK